MPGAFLSLLIAVVGALLVGPLLDTGPRAVIDQALEPGRLHALLYYSLGTLTTLSAGDIVPLTPPVRTLSVIEAATGQLYLTVLIARLVGLQIAESSER